MSTLSTLSTTITAIHLRPYRLPFQRDFATGRGPMRPRAGIIVTLHTSAGVVGLGDAAPLPEFGAHLSATQRALAAAAHALPGQSLPDALHHLYHHPASDPASDPDPAATFALETALLDTLAQLSGQPLAAYLAPPASPPPPSLAVNAVIGALPTDTAIAAAQAAVAAGYTTLKLKIGPSPHEVERVAAIAAAIGPHIRLRLDANGSWPYATALETLRRYAAHPIEYIEQPLPPHDLAAQRRLRLASPIPIAADEACATPQRTHELLAAEAADLLILKPQLLGGLRACQRLTADATAHGVACILTTAIESGVGVAATLHLALASPAITRPCGLATLPLLADDLITPGLPIHAGTMPAPTAPGLGVTLDQAALHAYATPSPTSNEKA